MFEQLRRAFGDPSPESLIAAAKATLRSPNAPLQERAAAIERLSVELDAESKGLVLSHAADPLRHEWLQQTAGEAVAQMLQSGTLRVEDVKSLSPVAAATVVSILGEVGSQETQALLVRIEAISQA
ncbi:hypothetical protein HZ992_14720 [Rhizobacter sp. AJA081-3]|uniref:hypothetical protein n=1 Tax=Rhizobacter sp. AJA081-3 TaxID=2753607 RepID=UPI001AE0D85F|nr:hypothetical protein [Rhizobacter sp. AJA081-3]QTN21437.1 hypothetical protein HZ992_14720 [Rhizobacter sp. AJA081-3]